MIRNVRRLAQLYLGLVLYGVSMDLMVRSRLGLDGWDVLHQGLSKLTGYSMGTVTIAVGALVLIGWIPLRQRPGFGTLSNVVVVGLAFDAVLPWIAVPHLMLWRLVTLAGGISLCGLATGLYISVGWGPGPRDGLMTGLSRRMGWSIRLTRTGLELTVLSVGWLLGGTVGIGTVAFAMAIGPISQFFLAMFGRPEPSAQVTRPRRPSGPATSPAARPAPRTPGSGRRSPAGGRRARPGSPAPLHDVR